MSLKLFQDIPKCSFCHAIKKDSQLVNQRPMAPMGEKYLNAYCRLISECESKQAEQRLEQFLNTIVNGELHEK